MQSEHDLSLRALGRVVQQMREQKDIGVAELAKAGELPEKCIQALEAGHLDPTYELLHKIADGLGVPTSTLIAQVEQLLASKGA